MPPIMRSNEYTMHYYPEAMNLSGMGLTSPDGWKFLTEPVFPAISDVAASQDDSDIVVHFNLKERTFFVEDRASFKLLMQGDYNVSSESRAILGDEDEDDQFIDANPEVGEVIHSVMEQAYPTVDGDRIRIQMQQWETIEPIQLSASTAYAERHNLAYPDNAEQIFEALDSRYAGWHESLQSLAQEQAKKDDTFPLDPVDLEKKVSEIKDEYEVIDNHYFRVAA